MVDLIDTLSKKSPNQIVLYWAGSLLLMIILGYYLFVSKSLNGLTEASDKVLRLTDEVAELKSRLARLDKLKNLKGILEEKIVNAEKELPEKEEMPRLLSTLSGLAKSSGLDIKLWRKESEISQDFYVELPVSVEVIGSYHQVATFFDEVGRLDRIVNINKISITEPNLVGNSSMRVKTACVVTTFRQLTEEEKKEREESLKNAKKRRR